MKYPERVFPRLISCTRWLMLNRQESLRTGRREKSPSFLFFPEEIDEGPGEMREWEMDIEREERERERVTQSWLAQDQQQQKHLDNRAQ